MELFPDQGSNLVGEFLTTEPPGKSLSILLCILQFSAVKRDSRKNKWKNKEGRPSRDFFSC